MKIGAIIPRYWENPENMALAVNSKSISLWPTQIVMAFIPITTKTNVHFL